VTAWFKAIASLTVGLIAACVLRVILPSDRGLSFLRGAAFHVVPFNRVAFWLCVLVAVIVAACWVARAETAW